MPLALSSVMDASAREQTAEAQAANEAPAQRKSIFESVLGEMSSRLSAVSLFTGPRDAQDAPATIAEEAPVHESHRVGKENDDESDDDDSARRLRVEARETLTEPSVYMAIQPRRPDLTA